jgi:hypothetical protein
VNVFASSRRFDTLQDSTAKVGVALSRKAYTEGTRRDRAETIAIDAGTRAFQQSAVNQRTQQTKDRSFGQMGALNNLGET